jgi:hypothetical protein
MARISFYVQFHSEVNNRARTDILNQHPQPMFSINSLHQTLSPTITIPMPFRSIRPHNAIPSQTPIPSTQADQKCFTKEKGPVGSSTDHFVPERAINVVLELREAITVFIDTLIKEFCTGTVGGAFSLAVGELETSIAVIFNDTLM